MNYKIISIHLITALFLVGCGGTSINENSNQDTIEPPTEPLTELPIEYISTNDPLITQQWSIFKDEEFYRLNNINADAHINALNSIKTLSGKGIKVAIIDNGFEIHHPELSSKIISTNNFNNGSDDIDNVANKNYHGTAVTGIIASSANSVGIRGIAPNVELILIQMPEYLTDSTTIEMFDKAVELGADIINCSWGTGNVSDAVRERLNVLSSNTPEGGRDGKGVLIVFASGNDDSLMNNDESSVEGVIAVGATSSDNLRTSYSSYGPELDIMAPGGQYLGITTLDLLGEEGSSSDGYIRYDELKDGMEKAFVGTSASAPIISGVLALALEKDTHLTVEEMKKLLKLSTDKISLNIPYLYDIEITNKTNPVFSGILGSSSNTEFELHIFNQNNNSLGVYPISFNGNNTWTSTVTDALEEGEYKAVLMGENIVFATDSSFIVDFSVENTISKEYSKNDFYGYGKINLNLLISNIEEN